MNHGSGQFSFKIENPQFTRSSFMTLKNTILYNNIKIFKIYIFYNLKLGRKFILFNKLVIT
jgi:hypothetical protein